MRVRMIFGTSVGRDDWQAGQCYEATPAQAATLIGSGRAEPAEPSAEESASEPAPKRARKK